MIYGFLFITSKAFMKQIQEERQRTSWIQGWAKESSVTEQQLTLLPFVLASAGCCLSSLYMRSIGEAHRLKVAKSYNVTRGTEAKALIRYKQLNPIHP